MTSLLPGGPGDWPITCLRGVVPADNRPGVCTYTPRRSTRPIGSQLIVYREGHGRSPTGSGSGKVDEVPLVSQPQSQYTDYAVVDGGRGVKGDVGGGGGLRGGEERGCGGLGGVGGVVADVPEAGLSPATNRELKVDSI